MVKTQNVSEVKMCQKLKNLWTYQNLLNYVHLFLRINCIFIERALCFVPYNKGYIYIICIKILQTNVKVVAMNNYSFWESLDGVHTNVILSILIGQTMQKIVI